MRSVRPSDAPVSRPPPARRRWARSAVAVGVTVAAFAVGGWYFARERARAAERIAAMVAVRDQSPDAGERLNACLARDPNDAEMVEALVVWSLKTGAPFAAVEPHLTKLCELRPADPAPWRIRAAQRIRNGHATDGLADGFRALELDPNDHITRKLIANAAFEAGQHEVAAREFAHLLDSAAFPQDEIAAALVQVHLQAGEVGRAEQALDRYFPATRTDAESLFLRGLVHQGAGRHAEAVPALRTVADRFPDHRQRALFGLARSLSALGRDADARRALDELEAAQARERGLYDALQQPDDLSAQVRAAEHYLADGKPKEAAAVLERAVAKLGRSPAAAAVLARAYRQLGRDDLARLWESTGR